MWHGSHPLPWARSPGTRQGKLSIHLKSVIHQTAVDPLLLLSSGLGPGRDARMKTLFFSLKSPV